MSSANSSVMTDLSSSFRFQLPMSLSVALHGIIAAVLFLNPTSKTIFVGASSDDASSVNWVDIAPLAPVKSRELWDEKSDIVVKKKKVAVEVTGEVAPSTQASSASASAIGSASSRPMSPNEFSDYVSGLRKLIDGKKQYPALSRRMGETGRVVVTLRIMRDGSIRAPSVKQASAHSRLNEAALATVSGIDRYEPLPEVVSDESLNVDIPIEFQL